MDHLVDYRCNILKSSSRFSSSEQHQLSDIVTPRFNRWLWLTLHKCFHHSLSFKHANYLNSAVLSFYNPNSKVSYSLSHSLFHQVYKSEEKTEVKKKHSFIDLVRTPKMRKQSLIVFYLW